MRRSFALASLALLVGCGGSTPNQTEKTGPLQQVPGDKDGGAAAGAAAGVSGGASADLAAPAAAPRKRSRADVPETFTADPGLRKALAAALRDGRKATAAGDYPAALLAFDRALGVQPGFARALSGRGYARLLAGELDMAEEDFVAALAGTSDPKLRAAIHFNLGLLAEKRGETGAAEASFRLSQRLRPSEAAAAKLRDRCVAVDRQEIEAITFAGWSPLGQHLEAFAVDAPTTPLPGDEAGVRSLLCAGGACEGPAPWLVARAGSMALVEEAKGGRVRALIVAQLNEDPGNGWCEASMARVPGPVLHVSAALGCETREMIDTCEGSGEEREECYEPQWNAGRSREDYFFVASPLRRVLKVSRHAWAEDKTLGDLAEEFEIDVTVEPGGVVRVVGRECDVREAIGGG